MHTGGALHDGQPKPRSLGRSAAARGWRSVSDRSVRPLGGRSVAGCTPEWAAGICGVEPGLIREVARVWGPARTSFLLHARGVEQHT